MDQTTSPRTPTGRMRRNRWLLSGAALVITIMIGALVWWAFQDTPDAEDPQLALSTPVPQAVTYVVRAEESTLTATSESPLGAVESRYEMGLGVIELNEEPDGWRVIANLTFDARTLDIGNDAVNAMLREILQVDRYPTGRFVAVSETPVTNLDEPFTVDLVGQLELYGTVQDFTVPTTITLAGARLALTAQMVIDAAVFGDSPGMGGGLDADLAIIAYEGPRPPELDATLTAAPPAALATVTPDAAIPATTGPTATETPSE